MASLLKRGKVWYYRSYQDGRDVWKSTKKIKKEDAEKYAREMEASRKGQGDVEHYFSALLNQLASLPAHIQTETRTRLARRLMMLQGTTMEIAVAWQAWLDSPMKGNPEQITIDGYKCIWNRFEKWAAKQGFTHLHEIALQQVEDYARDLWRQNLAPRTFNGQIVFLKGLFNVLKNRAGILENPWATIKRLERQTQSRKNFSTTELATICQRATGSHRYMIAVGLYTGLRLGDVVNLRWDSIHNNHIQLVPSKTKRKGKSIVIPLHPVLATLLVERRKEIHEEYVFPVERALYASDVTAVTRRFQAFLEDVCGIVTTEKSTGHRKNVIVRKSFHSLRHSFVSLCAMNRVPQVAIQDLVGHGSPAMTALYSHADFDQKQAAIATLPEISFAPEASG
jgi:integrase